MRYLSLVITFFLPFFLFSQERVDFTLQVDGVERTALAYLNADYQDGNEWPLIINMHGLGSNAIQQEFYSYFNSVADTSEFIVVYPQGLIANNSTHWNAGFGSGVDDVGFINELIDYMHFEYNIDLSRVYSIGMSNGGYMSYTLACELSDRIAAIGSVTGAMVFSEEESCNPGYVPPILQMHGTQDNTVPFNGNANQNSIPHIVDVWKEKHGCSEENEHIEYPDINTDDDTTIESFSYTDCESGGEVILYVVDGGGHTWPGALEVPGLGPVNQDILGSNHIWDFLRKYQHPNPLVVSNIEESNEIDLSIYPNPSSGLISIETKDQINSIEVYNLIGELITVNKEINQQLDLSALDSGMYILKFDFSNGNSVSKKLSIQ